MHHPFTPAFLPPALALSLALAIGACTNDCGLHDAPEEAVQAPAPEAEPTPALRVDGTTILSVDEMERQLQALVERHEAADPDSPRNAEWRNLRRRQIAREALANALVARAVADANPSISEDAVDAHIEATLGSLATNSAAFARYLAARGTTAERFREEVRAELAEASVLAEYGPLTPDDEAVRAFHEEFRERWRAGERILVESAALRLPPGVTAEARDAAMTRISSLRQEVHTGSRTMTEARNSLSTAQADRDASRWLVRGEALPMLDVAASTRLFDLPPGSLSPVLEGPSALLFVKIHERRPEGVRPLDEVEEAVRRPLEQRLRREARRALAAQMQERLEVELLEANWVVDQD